MLRFSVLVFAFWGSVSSASFITPDPKQTPGALCTSRDETFGGYDYAEHVARCDREVSREEKLKVAAAYGNIPESDWPKYEFDHLIPLCAGGANDARNIWPQPLGEARLKDQVENDVCLKMKAGTLTQAVAVQQVFGWFTQTADAENNSNTSQVYCQTVHGVVVRFDIVESGWIANVFVNVEDNNGEHEALHVESSVAGKAVRQTKSHIFDGFNAFKLSSADQKDLFEVYLPGNLTGTQKTFSGFLKVAFDGGFPRLSRLTCTK